MAKCPDALVFHPTGGDEMYCSECGNQIQNGVAFCPHCGFSTQAPQAIGANDQTETQPPITPLPANVSVDDAQPSEFPKTFTINWATACAFIAACVIDIFLLRYARGVNILFVGCAVSAIWVLPLVRDGKTRHIPTFPLILLIAMTVSMFFQSSGPIDRVLYPLWVAVFLFFGVSCRNRLLGLENKPVNSISDRWPLLRRSVGRGAKRAAGTHSNRTKASQILLGLIVAIPIGGIVLSLLAGADKAFAKSLSDLFNNLSEVYSHVAWIIFFSVAFFLWGSLLVLARERKPRPPAISQAQSFPLLSMSVIIASLAGIILCFLIVHLRTLLLSEQEIRSVTGEPYFVYIRKGFAELLVVEAIIGVTILCVIHAKSWKADARVAHRVLAWALILFTMLLSVSCGMRLWYYVTEYGLTLVRSMNAMGVIISFVCLALLSVRVVRPADTEHTIGGVARIFMTAYVLWSCTMPVRVIAVYNVPRYLAGHQIELKYLAYLGPDAYSPMSEVLRRGKTVMNTPDREKLSRAWVDETISLLEKRSWVEWNPGTRPAIESLKTVDTSKLQAKENSGSNEYESRLDAD